MTVHEYFGDWLRVIDMDTLNKVLFVLRGIYSTHVDSLMPCSSDVFRAFRVCPYNSLNAVFLGQDPYPQKGVATGIAFGNRNDIEEEKLSPSLKILKECVIDFEIPHNFINFDNSLESWSRQGILMLNSALTVGVNRPGSYTMLWRPFISKLLYNLSRRQNGIVYVLFGNQARTFKPYIQSSNNYILEERHPSYYARTGEKMDGRVFRETERIVKGLTNTQIIWYEQENEQPDEGYHQDSEGLC